MISNDRQQEKESMAEFIAKKREMFLVQMSLDTKREEIRKLEEKARMKEEALRKSEQARNIFSRDSSDSCSCRWCYRAQAALLLFICSCFFFQLTVFCCSLLLVLLFPSLLLLVLRQLYVNSVRVPAIQTVSHAP